MSFLDFARKFTEASRDLIDQYKPKFTEEELNDINTLNKTIMNTYLSSEFTTKCLEYAKRYHDEDLIERVEEKYNSMSKVMNECSIKVLVSDLNGQLTNDIDLNIEQLLHSYHPLLRLLGGERWNHIFDPERSKLNIYKHERNFGRILRNICYEESKRLLDTYVERLLSKNKDEINDFFETLRDTTLDVLFH